MNRLDRAIEILREDGARQLSERAALRVLKESQREFLEVYLPRNTMSRSDLEDERSNGRIWFFEPDPSITYTPPEKKGAPPELARYTTECQPERPFVCELPSCTLFGPAAIGFSSRGELILETASGDVDFLFGKYGGYFGRNPVAKLFGPSSTEGPNSRVSSHVFPLVPVYDRSYYHWILLYLPKLRALERYERETGTEPTILVEDDPPSFVTGTLSLLGYGPDRVVEWKGGKRSVENLVFTKGRVHSTKLNTYEHSLGGYRWLRDELRSGVDTSGSRGKKIYISRQEADRGRAVVNYDEVMTELESRGFSPVVMESLPVEEQIELVSGADTIVGPHGAGLVNMVFAEDPTVIELFPESFIKPHFYMLADLMGFAYRSLVTDSIGEHDLRVDVEGLRDVLDEDDET